MAMLNNQRVNHHECRQSITIHISRSSGGPGNRKPLDFPPVFGRVEELVFRKVQMVLQFLDVLLQDYLATI
jgi:hypothetical protein